MIKKEINFKFQDSSIIIKNINFKKPIKNIFNELSREFNFDEDHFMLNAKLYINTGDHLESEDFNEVWSKLDIDFENANEIKIIENKKYPLKRNKVLKITTIDNSGRKFEFENPLKTTSIQEIKKFIYERYGIPYKNQILYLSNEINKKNDFKIILNEDKLIQDYINDDFKGGNNLIIHLKESKIIKLILLKKVFEFESWANEKVEILQELFFEFLKNNHDININRCQIWIINKNEEIDRGAKLEDYNFTKINVKFKIEVEIFYEDKHFEINSLDLNTKISKIKLILCNKHNFSIPENHQNLFFEGSLLKNYEKISDFLDVIKKIAFFSKLL